MSHRVVHPGACVYEAVLELADGAMEAPEQRPGLVGLAAVVEVVVGVAGDVSQLPPHRAFRFEAQLAVRRGNQSRGQ